MIPDPAAFITANTRLQPVPHAPEISLWLADEVTPIWRLTEEELGEMGLPPPVDVICAGDICYEKPMADQVLAWLHQAKANGTRVLIGDPGRTYFPRTGLTFLAEYRVPTTRELEDQEIKRSSVWAL